MNQPAHEILIRRREAVQHAVEYLAEGNPVLTPGKPVVGLAGDSECRWFHVSEPVWRLEGYRPGGDDTDPTKQKTGNRVNCLKKERDSAATGENDISSTPPRAIGTTLHTLRFAALASFGGSLNTLGSDPLFEPVFKPMHELLGRYRALAERLDSAIAALAATLGEPALPTAPESTQLARIETPTADLTALLEFQERLAELDGVLKVTVAGSAGGRASFLVELASAETAMVNRIVCSNCGRLITEGIDPPSHSLCDNCRSDFGQPHQSH